MHFSTKRNRKKNILNKILDYTSLSVSSAWISAIIFHFFEFMFVYVYMPKRDSYWVEARVFPSGPNAAAMVDLGGGSKGQYLADKCCNDSASTLDQ